MRKISTIMYFMVLTIITVKAQTGWTSLSSGVTSDLMSIRFTNSSTGHIAGYYGKILKTTNSGSSWTSYTSGAADMLNSIFFVNANTGFSVDGSGKIYKTSNAGTSWSLVSTGTGYILNSVFFTDANTGYAVGSYGSTGAILKTTNGGSNWTPQTSGTNFALRSVFFINSTTGFAVGNYGALTKTTNGGTNWVPTSGFYYNFNSVYFTDVNTGYVVGESGAQAGVILKTTDGGSNWTTKPMTNNLYSIYFSDQNTGYIVGYWGTILKTIDAGVNWATQTSGVYNTFRSVFFIDNNNGFVVGEAGIILKTTNGGEILPSNAGTITGYTNVCQGQSAVVYTVQPITNATSYIWTLPNGVIGTSTTNTITVDYSIAATSGDITVCGHNSVGNGSIATLSITVKPVPPTPVITQNGNILTSSAVTGNQWYNSTGPISGSISQNYTATTDGSYYVIVTVNGCSSSQSNTINVSGTIISEILEDSPFYIYPNPATDFLVFEAKSEGIAEIYNSQSKIIFQKKISDRFVLNLNNIPKGFYLCRLRNDNNISYYKLIVE